MDFLGRSPSGKPIPLAVDEDGSVVLGGTTAPNTILPSDAPPGGWLVIASLLPGAASGVQTGTAQGKTLVANASLHAGPAQAGMGAFAGGKLLVATPQMLGGVASGLRVGTATGKTITAAASLLGGTALGGAGGRVLSAFASLIPGAAIGVTPGNAAGKVLQASASLLAGSAIGGAADGSLLFNSTSNKYQTVAEGEQWEFEGDNNWTLTATVRFPADAGGGPNYMISVGTSSAGLTHASSNNLQVLYSGGVLWATGRDGANTHIGTQVLASGQAGLKAEWFEDGDISGQGQDFPTTIFLEHEIISGKHWFRIWVSSLPGGAPKCVAEEVRDTFTGIIHHATLGSRRDAFTGMKGYMSRVGKVSYLLTKKQKALVTQGTNPGTFGTPAATDFFYLLNAAPATITSTFGSRTLIRTGTVTVGPTLVPVANPEAVLIEPLGPNGHIMQFHPVTHLCSPVFNWLAVGATGAGEDIQFKITDFDTDQTVINWQTAVASIGASEGTLTVPDLLPGDYTIRGRKLKNGVAQAEIGKIAVGFSVGVTTPNMGQSLADHKYTTSGFNGGTINEWVAGAKISVGQRRYGDAVISSKSITGCVNNGAGLCRVTVDDHGMRTGEIANVFGMSGVPVVGAFPVIPVGQDQFDLVGSTFSGAYASGGTLTRGRMCWRRVPPRGAFIAGAIQLELSRASVLMGCRVGGVNIAYGGAAIESFYNNLTQQGAHVEAVLRQLDAISGVGLINWEHGTSNFGQSNYHADSGSYPSLVGFGKMGTLYNYLNGMLTASALLWRLHVTGAEAKGGKTSVSPDGNRDWMRRFSDWAVRAKAAGMKVVEDIVDSYDIPAIGEMNNLPMTVHKAPHHYQVVACRVGHGVACAFGYAQKPRGPILTSVFRAGPDLYLNFDLQGVSARLQTPGFSDSISGVSVGTSSAMSTLLAKNFAELIGDAQAHVQLAADPGAEVWVDLLRGRPGDWPTADFGTPAITAVVASPIGELRLTVPVTSTSPAHGMVDDEAAWFINLNKRGLIGADGRYKVRVVSADTIDLQGSVFAGTFTNSANDQATIEKASGNYIYDDRNIALEALAGQTFGMPARPTNTPVQSSSVPGANAAGRTLVATSQMLGGTATGGSAGANAAGKTFTAAASLIVGEASGESGAITINNPQRGSSGATGNSLTISNYVIPSVADRRLVVAPVGEAALNVNCAVTAVSFGAVALTQGPAVIQTDTGRASSAQWYLDNPPISTANIVITYGSASTSRRGAIAVTLGNVDTSVPPEGNSTGNALEAVSTILSSALASGIALDAAIGSSESAITTTEGAQTVVDQFTLASAGNGFGMGVSSQPITGPGFYTAGWQRAAGAGRMAHCITSHKIKTAATPDAAGVTLVATASLVAGLADGGGTQGSATGKTFTASASLIPGVASTGSTLVSTPIVEAPVLNLNLKSAMTGVTFLRVGTAWEDTSGLLLSYANNVPRRTNDRGLLIERALTNEVLNNSDLANAAWVKLNATATSNTTDTDDPRGPGNQAASKLMATATTGVHSARRTALSFTGGAARRKHVVFGDFKPNGYTKVRLRIFPDVSTLQYIGAIYDLVNLTMVPERGIDKIEPVYLSLHRRIRAKSNGWRRIELGGILEPSNSSPSLSYEIALVDDGGNVNFLGDVTKGVFEFGLGIQTNHPRATHSVAVVAGTAITRNSEQALFDPAPLARQTCGLFFNMPEACNDFGALMDTSNGGKTGLGVRLEFDAGGRLRIHVGNRFVTTPEPAFQYKKLIVGWSATGIDAHAANGSSDLRAIGAETFSVTTPVPGATGSLGHTVSGADHLDSWFGEVIAYPIRPTSEQALWLIENH